MELKELFQKQRDLMAKISEAYQDGVYKDGPAGHPDGCSECIKDHEIRKTEEARILVLALTSELHEVLGEINWKPWKKTKKTVDLDKLGEELADCWHFLLELTMVFNQDERIEQLLEKTFKKNHERAETGY